METPSTPISKDIESVLRGHPYKAIMRLAWPATFSMILHTLFAVVDLIWVGRLGAVPIAAVISATFVLWIMYSLVSILSTGVVAVVSQSLGAGRYEQARDVAEETWRFALLFACAIAIPGYFFRQPIIDFMHLEPLVAKTAADYLGIYFLTSIFIVISEWAAALFRASGNTRTPLYVFAVGLVLNMVLDPIFIFGIGPFPRLETVGAAVATAISYGLSTLLIFLLLRGNRLPFTFKFTLLGRMDWRRIGRLVMIGVPISISGIVFSIVYLFINRFTAGFGTETVATLGIGNRIESINYLMAYGFSLATATLVGQNLGANNPKRAAEMTHKTIQLVSAYVAVTSLIFLVFPDAIVRVFTDDPAVMAAGRGYVRILAVSQVFMGWEIVLEGAFSGAGYTWPPMIVAIPGAVGRIPLAWFFADHWQLGPDGIWWAISATTVAKGVVLYFWFARGTWKRGRIH
jgi:putative MATE family efflux protein